MYEKLSTIEDKYFSDLPNDKYVSLKMVLLSFLKEKLAGQPHIPLPPFICSSFPLFSRALLDTHKHFRLLREVM